MLEKKIAFEILLNGGKHNTLIYIRNITTKIPLQIQFPQ